MSGPGALLGGLSPEAFLERHWQKRPLLVRNAWPEFPWALGADELAGLALEPDVESRVVMGETAQEDWILLQGPFEPEFFHDTPARDWTLLVQDVEKHLPALGAVLEPFRFLPDWRIDDLMVSYAAPGGTVGPHRDRYDVFLLQVSGQREWAIQYPAPASERLREHPDLRLLTDFTATERWTVGPGDLLYLPPGVPHYGIAVDDCITYSIGFRAPSVAELLRGWADECLRSASAELGYDDPDLRRQANPAEIPPAALARLRDQVRRHLAADDLAMDRWLGRFLTEPKPAFARLERASPLAPAELAAAVQAGRRLRRNPAARVSLVRYDSERIFLYAQGEEYRLGPALHGLAETLGRQGWLAAADLAQPAALEQTAEWLNRGILLFADELEESE
ncbi:cupin domain-containing protein [Sediminicurvatus halobius]|uniref:Cupin n=1 Tax=Sediminicurvatus halobius TaxID=2182432 RepID=A0A2U2N941_9GAMM|nr:cupin domain-containing protein [Spiribacter halobius]PWG65509.1 cupin [Spiribacter halobius]UEX76533.1 AraC family ligand binding domain-containing protein [Spiribacter halobius]